MFPSPFYADVILPLALQKAFTYSIPPELKNKISVGQRVVVQFGKKKIYTAIVKKIHAQPPAYQIKEIIDILDDFPAVNTIQLSLWEWISSYYLCSVGEVMNVALPSAMKLQSETRVVLSMAEIPENIASFTEKEQLVIDALHTQNILSLDEITKITGQKTIFPIIKSLAEKGIIATEEELIKKYKPLITEYIRLSGKAQNEAWLKSVFDAIEKKAPKQLALLMTFLKLYYENKQQEIRKSDLLQKSDTDTTVLNQLVKKEVFEIYEKETGRLNFSQTGKPERTALNEQQQQALQQIKELFKTKDVVLLHGVTSSGKTEVYIKLMEETLAQGKQVLYLLPEIALTTQIINRLVKIFGNRVMVYHSKLGENERVEMWKNVQMSEYADVAPKVESKENRDADVQIKNNGNSQFTYLPVSVILGARSAVFLPFNNLGLVITDEEHDSSFKQFDPAPRYNARDTAIYLARLQKAKTIIGSATPSLESYFNARNGKYGLVELKERYGGVNMPEIIIADNKEELRKKTMKSHFSSLLLEHIRMALETKEQVILFQNRRGFAPVLQCSVCGWVPHCVHCDVSLTYHKLSNHLRCHYCGYSQPVAKNCIACGNAPVKMLGFGTEKIEEELAVFFPDAVIARMDLDSTRSKNSYQRIIRDFEEQRIDILVGTQMVTKGLDFNHVSLVGILSADSMMTFPDFRAYEKSFQLMAQVSGRAGRKQKRGKVVIQTYNPAHRIIRQVLNNNYEEMYSTELAERKKFNYPPFYRLLQITLKHKDILLLSNAADELAKELKVSLGQNRVLGPEVPLVARIKNLYLKNILIKIEKDLSANEAKNRILAVKNRCKILQENGSIQIQTDVDPM